MKEIAIKVEKLTKMYKLYDKPMDRLKESLGFSKKRRYHNHYALNNINFDIYKGETVGIIGTNGAGKSTILKIITGVLNATDGEVLVKGRISALLELGAGFNPEYTGIENIYLNGTMLGYTRREMDEKIESILKFADIGEFVYQPVKNYSSGMFARLAFAVAINVEPDILIVDEALSVGDVFFQSKCFGRFEKLREKGTTILFVSHDIGSIRQMCSRVLWLEKGEQKMFGETQQVCEQYINQQFLNNNNLQQGLLNENIIQDSQSDIEFKGVMNRKEYPGIRENENNILSDKVKILSCYITNKDGQVVESLEILNKYTIHVIGQITAEKMDRLICGVILENSKGINLLALNTYINNKKKTIEGINGDLIEVKFEIILPKIIKGEYLISPAIAQGDQQHNVMLTWLHGAVAINILNEGYNASLLELDAETQVNIYREE